MKTIYIYSLLRGENNLFIALYNNLDIFLFNKKEKKLCLLVKLTF